MTCEQHREIDSPTRMVTALRSHLTSDSVGFFIFMGVVVMIVIGCLARYFNSYEHEVTFARENGFQLL